MAIIDLIIGRKNTGADPHFGNLNDGQIRAFSLNKTTAHMWLHTLGGKLGKAGTTNATARLGVYEANSDKEPDARLGQTGDITLSTQMTSGSNGTNVEAAITGGAIPVASGTRLSLAVLITDADARHGMIAAASISADDERFFDLTGRTTLPNPYGSASASVEGHLTLWGLARQNEAPRPPADRSPSSTVSELAPTFSGSFRDRNGSWGTANDGVDDGDELNKYQIQVRRVSDGQLMWNAAAFTASSSEKSNDAFSRAYAGSSLTRGVAYEWRCRVSDYFGAWSDWSDWLAFTPASLGSVTPTSPSGRITELTPDFSGTYTHANSVNADRVQIRLYQGSTLIATSPEITKAVSHAAAPGTAFTITWSESEFSDLAWGTQYYYAIRARDTDEAWSDWSSRQPFNTNYAPDVPTNLAPDNGEVVTSYPLLTCTAYDADNAPDVLGGYFVYARIMEANGSVISIEGMTYNAGADRWEYQTDSGDLATFDDYRWDAHAYDGTAYSGGDTSTPVYSDEATFSFVDGPEVAIDAPTDAATITTSTPLIEWTASEQSQYRVTVTRDSDDTLIYDTDWVVSTDASFEIPAGYLRNETAYQFQVSVKDNSNVEGTSAPVTVTLSYTPPADVANFQALAVTIGNDPFPTAIRLFWDQTEIGEEEGWQGYTLYRDDLTNPLAVITSASQTVYTDYLPVSGREYVYTLRQTQLMEDVELVESEGVDASASVTLRGVVLTDVINPATLRAVLSQVDDYSDNSDGDEETYASWTATAPTTYRAPLHYWRSEIEAHITEGHPRLGGVSADTRVEELRTLARDGGTLCVRHGWNGLSGKRFCVIERDGLSIRPRRVSGYDVTLAIRDEDYTEMAR